MREAWPLRDPLSCKVGHTLPVRVLFKGEPLPEVNVGWQHPGDGEAARGYVRTDPPKDPERKWGSLR
jgi:uncharacterized GH25 family protein